MQENEFEKQVQQKMDELKIIPSDDVWQRIEPQIRKEKKRRGIFFLLPVILIGFLYGGYLFVNRSNELPEHKQSLTKNSIKKNDPVQIAKPKNDLVKNNILVAENKRPIFKILITKNNGDQKIKTQQKLRTIIDHDNDQNFEKVVVTNKKTTEPKQNIIENGGLSSNIKNSEQGIILPAEEVKSDSLTVVRENSLTVVKETTVLNIIDSVKNIPEKKNENAKAVSHKKVIAANNHLWNWGVSLSVGKSGMASDLLSTLFGSAQDKSLSSNFSSTPSPVTSVPTPTASLIKPAIALLAGITVERKINKIIFTTGLNYKLFSTTNTTGTDSANYFTATSNIKTYHNFYHYIELPLGIKFQIAHLKKIKLSWSVGSSITQLIGSNALQFNNSTGLYYHDNSLFNKTQFGLNTGLDFKFSPKQKNEFLVGPYLNYGISKIASQGYNKHHFTFIGLRTQIIFRKK